MTELINMKLMNVMTKFKNPVFLYCFLHGISAGLPLLLIGSTLQAMLFEAQINLETIGLMALIKIPYSFKFLWAPILDYFHLPFLGRRKGWIFLFQILLTVSLLLLAMVGTSQLIILNGIGFLLAFFSASQDIVIDAYRRENLSNDDLAMGVSFYIYGYRIALMISGALALILADHMSWSHVYFVMAGITFMMGLFTLRAPKEKEINNSNQSLTQKQKLPNFSEWVQIYWEPLKDFFQRHQWFILLIFILLYKMGDAVASNMFTPFFLDLGYSKTDQAYIVKTFGLFSTLIGVFLGGLGVYRFGLKKALFIFGIFQMISTFGFMLLQNAESKSLLAIVISFENITSGMGNAAFTAFMAMITNRQYTGTQTALLTSLIGVPRDLVGSLSGFLAEGLGYQMFFAVCGFIALPGLILLLTIKLQNAKLPVGNLADTDF